MSGGIGRRLRIAFKTLAVGVITGGLLGALWFVLVDFPGSDGYLIFLCQIPAVIVGGLIGGIVGLVAPPRETAANAALMLVVAFGVVGLGCSWMIGETELVFGGIPEGGALVCAGPWLVRSAFLRFRVP
ncbi:hypothetical protein ACFL6C_08295 [Myxococcota bacterium]